jgi:hypothetical protein
LSDAANAIAASARSIPDNRPLPSAVARGRVWFNLCIRPHK